MPEPTSSATAAKAAGAMASAGRDTAAAADAAHALRCNPHVAALPAYNAGMAIAVARRIAGRDDIARLASNENADGCSPKVMQALASDAFEPWRYADPAATALREALARKLGVDAGEIVVGNGSEEMIAAAARAFIEPGNSALTVVPSFGLHEIEPLAAGATVVKLPMTPALGFDVEAIARELTTQPRLLLLSTPWNPVGPALDEAQLRKLVAALQPGTLFVLDEAYFEYADPGNPDGIALLRAAGVPHVVLRSFSKAYGLAGLRVGYAVCSDARVARLLAAAKTPFNVNAAAQIAALAALGDEAWMRASVARTRAERERVAAGLVELGLQVASSQTNFVFFETSQDSAELAGALLLDGIIVKGWREPGYERWVRATIGHAADNDRLLAALGRLLRA